MSPGKKAYYPKRQKSEYVKLNLRLSTGLHRRLVQYAKGDSPPLSLQQAIIGFIERMLDDKLSPETMAAIEAAAQAAADKVVERLKGADQPPRTLAE
jgi:hypothetical protein